MCIKTLWRVAFGSGAVFLFLISGNAETSIPVGCWTDSCVVTEKFYKQIFILKSELPCNFFYRIACVEQAVVLFIDPLSYNPPFQIHPKFFFIDLGEVVGGISEMFCYLCHCQSFFCA